MLYVVAGEFMQVASPFLQQQMHPTVIISAYRQALEDLLEILKDKVWWVLAGSAWQVEVGDCLG